MRLKMIDSTWHWLATISLVFCLLMPTPAWAATDTQHWNLTDQAGHGWGLTLFEQPDPAYPQGLRLRLNARAPGVDVDHDRPLSLSDNRDGAWTLPNRSAELVPSSQGAIIPAASAQFDAESLSPRPSDVLPLRLAVPLDDGSLATLTLSPDVVVALHTLPVSSQSIGGESEG
jgi:hypothetical protein